MHVLGRACYRARPSDTVRYEMDSDSNSSVFLLRRAFESDSCPHCWDPEGLSEELMLANFRSLPDSNPDSRDDSKRWYPVDAVDGRLGSSQQDSTR